MKILSLILLPIILCAAVNRVIAQAPSPLERNQEIGPPVEMPRESGRDRSTPYREPKLSNREKELVSPSKELQAEFKPYTKKTNTILARLYPDEKYAAAVGIFRTYTQYSFKNRTPVNELTNIDSDICLRDGKFLTGLAGADLGFLINLGDVALENVTFENPALKYLLTYKPSKIEKEVRKDQLQLLTSGITANGYLYHREAIVVPNHTYVVRCISFSADPISAHDYLIVFRTLRQLDDGSYIFAWKILKEFPRPIRWLSRTGN